MRLSRSWVGRLGAQQTNKTQHGVKIAETMVTNSLNCRGTPSIGRLSAERFGYFVIEIT
jgi:hypothetical protein